MTRSSGAGTRSARLALIPGLALSVFLTGCPLSDHYVLSDSEPSGDAGDSGTMPQPVTAVSGWQKMSASPLAARSRAAAVAIGKSVFIWGGSDGTGAVLDSGAIYSPETDTWQALPKDSATPSARVLATAVWTGSVVLVFGGSDATGAAPYKDGALYDPAKGAWSKLPAASRVRSSALGFWDGKRALFWGGVDAAGAAVPGVDRFDLTAWTESSTTGDPGALSNAAAAWDGATLYVEGGLLAGVRIGSAYSYASVSDTWASSGTSLSTYYSAFAAWDGTHFLVWGGRGDSNLHNDGQYKNGAEWVATSAVNAPSARMAVPRRSGWSFQVSPGVVAFFGGQTSLTGQTTFVTSGATYDVANARWTALAAWSSGENHDAGVGIWTGDQFVLWSGDNGALPSAIGERWRP